MRYLAFIIALTISLNMQAREHKQAYVAFSCSEFIHPVYDSGIKDVYKNENNKIVIRSAEGYTKCKTKYPLNEVWGFGSNDGTCYRVYNEYTYKLCQADTMTLYSRRVRSGKHYTTRYYFSRGLCSDLHRLEDKELKLVYGQDNPEFIARLKNDFKWYQGYQNYNNKHKSFKIVEVYKKTIS